MKKTQTNFLKMGTLYTIATFFNKGVSFITIPIYTRTISIDEYGIVNTFNSWQGILSMILSFALYMGIRAAFVNHEKRTKEVLSTVVTFTVGIGMIVIALVTIIDCCYLKTDYTFLIILCFLQAIFNSIQQDYVMYLMMNYQYKLRIIFMVLPSLLATIFSVVSILTIVKENKHYGIFIPTTIIYIIFIFVMLMLIYKDCRPMINKRLLGFCLKVSAPLILHGLSLYILTQSDRVMITYFRNTVETAIYSLVYNISIVVSVITSALDGIWIPWFTNQMKENNIKKVNQVGKDYVRFIAVLIIGILMVAPEVVKLLAPKEYWIGMSIIPAIVCSYLFQFLYTLYVNVEHYYMKTIHIAFNTIIAAIVNIILNVIFIPLYGFVAAAYTTLVAYTISYIMHAIYTKTLQKELFPMKHYWIFMVEMVISSGIYYMFLEIWYIRWIYIFVYLGLVIFSNRSKLFIYVPQLKSFVPFIKHNTK